MTNRILLPTVLGVVIVLVGCEHEAIVPPELSVASFARAAATPPSVRESFNALTEQDLDDFNLTSALWIDAFVDAFGQPWPDHAELVGFFAGEPDDAEHAPTYFTLRIPEGWETNGRLIFEQPPGVRDHTYVPFATDDFLQDGQAHIMVNTFDLSNLFLAPNSGEDFSKRMNQGVHRIKAFLERTFGDVTYTYATGFSRGGLALTLACERDGTPFDGLFAWEGGKDWKAFLTFQPYALRHGKTLADDPALERELSSADLVLVAQLLGLAVLEIDPDYLAEGGALADYDLSTRPERIQNYANSKKLATTGDVATKEILFWGLDDILAPPKLGTDYFQEILSQDKQDDVRLYIGKSYPHAQLFGQDVLNGMRLLQDWVENGTEPGALTTVLDGDVQHSRALGFEDDPVGYALLLSGQ